jgi:hypothetical protein
MNCWVIPRGIDGFNGERAIETNVGPVTVRVVDPWIKPTLAWTVVLPWVRPVASPVAPIVATPVTEELHAAEPDRS